MPYELDIVLSLDSWFSHVSRAALDLAPMNFAPGLRTVLDSAPGREVGRTMLGKRLPVCSFSQSSAFNVYGLEVNVP